MNETQIIIIVIAVILVLGIIVFPLINRRSFNKLPPDQKIRILMKEANSMAYFKNVSSGSTGVLYFVKNRRKILAFPWKLVDGHMLCSRKNPFEHWDYPEEQAPLTEDEQKLTLAELEKYNKKSTVKIYFE